MLANIIQYSLSNFSLSMFILAIVLAILNRFINRTPSFYEILYRWVAFLALGITGISRRVVLSNAHLMRMTKVIAASKNERRLPCSR